MQESGGKRRAVSPEQGFYELGISRALGYKLIKDGTIKAVRLGKRRLLIPVAELERLLNADDHDQAAGQ